MKKKFADGFEIYRVGLVTESWYWYLLRRGRIVADSGEGYTRKQDCLRAVLALSKWLRSGVPITVREH